MLLMLKVFCGEHVDGKKHGKGVIKWPNGRVSLSAPLSAFHQQDGEQEGSGGELAVGGAVFLQGG